MLSKEVYEAEDKWIQYDDEQTEVEKIYSFFVFFYLYFLKDLN